MSPGPLIFFLLCLLTFLTVIFFSFHAAGPAGHGQKETVKKRVRTILEYLDTVHEFINFDGYLALGFAQSNLAESDKDEETEKLIAFNYKILRNLYTNLSDKSE